MTSVEEENESSKENERKEGTTAVAEEDAWLIRDDLAMAGVGTLEGSADCDEPEPVLVLPTTISSPPVEGDEPLSSGNDTTTVHPSPADTIMRGLLPETARGKKMHTPAF